MKKIAKKIYAIFFFTLCCIPVLTMSFLDVENVNSKEKREKAEAPSIIEESGINFDYFLELDTYLTDNFNFRDNLITINSEFMENVFQTSAQSQVIVGKEDWIYFKETLSDYSRDNVLSDSEIEDIEKIITLISEYVEGTGAEFVFTIAPNKNSIYPEYMPSNYLSENNKSNAEKLGEVLSEDIYVNLFDVLRASEDITYLKRDSHWNNYGAYLGFDAMIKGLGIKEQNFNITGEEVRKEFEGDLDGMLYPYGEYYDEQIYHTFDTEFEYVSRFKTMDDISIETSSETGKDSIVVFRDSFGNALLEFFGRQFEEVKFSRAVPYQIDLAEEVDYMVLEIVERNIKNLLEKAPIMPAPVRDGLSLEAVKPEVIEIDEKSKYNHVYGYIDAENIDDIDTVYITINNVDYEAFPIIEEDLEVEYKENKKGFSAYIPKEAELNIDNIEIKY